MNYTPFSYALPPCSQLGSANVQESGASPVARQSLRSPLAHLGGPDAGSSRGVGPGHAARPLDHVGARGVSRYPAGSKRPAEEEPVLKDGPLADAFFAKAVVEANPIFSLEPETTCGVDSTEHGPSIKNLLEAPLHSVVAGYAVEAAAWEASPMAVAVLTR